MRAKVQFVCVFLKSFVQLCDISMKKELSMHVSVWEVTLV